MKQDYYICIITITVFLLSLTFFIINPENNIVTSVFSGAILVTFTSISTYMFNFKRLKGNMTDTMIKFKENLSLLDITIKAAREEIDYLENSKANISNIVTSIEQCNKKKNTNYLPILYMNLHNLQPVDTVQRYTKDIHFLLSENNRLGNMLTSYIMDLGHKPSVIKRAHLLDYNMKCITRHLYKTLVHLKTDTSSIMALELTVEDLRVCLDFPLSLENATIRLNLSDVLNQYYTEFQGILSFNPFIKKPKITLDVLSEKIIAKQGFEFMRNSVECKDSFTILVKNKLISMGFKE